ncbi:MAG: LysR family transcriptional regulator [Alphaproteobacteria bacterium]|nr:LysR family transcriptional regulator [Alphaproteobacteria bacterium]
MSTLQAMELFVWSVRRGSFSGAGRRAGLSPASVSRHIAQLEASLGVQLLNRTSRKLALTDAGRAYFERIEPALQTIREAGSAAGAFQATPTGTLRVHSRTMFGTRIIAPLIPRFQAIYPAVRIELRLAERPANMTVEEFDVELRIGLPPDSSLKQRLILPSERILVASPAYLDQMPQVARPQDLLAHRCLTYRLGPDEPVWRFLAGGRLDELVVPSGFSTNNGEVLRTLAVLGHGIALLDDYTVQPDIDAGRLVRLLATHRVTNSEFREGIYAIFHDAEFVPAKLQAFLDFLCAKGTVRLAYAALQSM